MKVSIITATYNSAKTISDCIASVRGQTYPDIEHIIIDGASDDNTIELIKSQPNLVKQLISEPDKGIYDAMNKGIQMATGEVIAILNSDDFYIVNCVIQSVIDVFKKSHADCVYADLFYVDKYNTDKIVRRWITKEYKYGSFKKGWHPAHPSFFVRKEVYYKYGAFDLSFNLAADFEFMLRMLEKNRIHSIYFPSSLVKMRLGGATNKNFLNIYNQNLECIKAFQKNGLEAGPLYSFYRLLPKLAQYFK